MSLAMTLYNHHGIIMCADKMITSTYKDDDNRNITIDMPPTEQKLFLIEDKYGLSYTGTASINNVPVSALLEKYFRENIIGESEPNFWLFMMAQYFKSQLADTGNIVFIMCGYFENKQIVMTTNTKNPQVITQNGKPKIIYSGETDFADIIINNKAVSFEYAKFTMQDSVNLLYFINNTVANMMYWGQYLPTVSKECDVLAIYPNKSHWVQHETLRL